ncbi:MAG: hypothetical protein QF713_05230 [Dehalococcoidales bacterium]|nr:hypothetical protein [Dehalococcoidales bacterium]MDP7525720.1 hypothetical protein [Dehalococcoidales bacterium]
MSFPRMLRISQTTEGLALDDVVSEVKHRIGNLGLGNKVDPGQTIAITAGSRGIANISQITRAVVDECKSIGLVPFIVPAMGSHGGATAEGQWQILEHYGITEQNMGCPIRSNMEVIHIGEVKNTPVFCDLEAWQADHIAVVARVKSHTDFEGEIESGLFKMMAVGLGKKEGAEQYHRLGTQYSYAEIFPAVGKKVLETSRILFGLAIVENSREETARVEALLPADFYLTEKSLLIQARQWAAHLPFDNLDLLIVDEMGKEISGTGMDSSVIGRHCVQRFPLEPKVRWLFVRELSPQSDGNALGIGMADFTTGRLVDRIDYSRMAVNAITSANPDGARVPLTLDNDNEVIETALGIIGLTPPDRARVVRIKNTLRLTEMDVSESLLDEVETDNRLSRISGLSPMTFDGGGNLLSF